MKQRVTVKMEFYLIVDVEEPGNFRQVASACTPILEEIIKIGGVQEDDIIYVEDENMKMHFPNDI